MSEYLRVTRVLPKNLWDMDKSWRHPASARPWWQRPWIPKYAAEGAWHSLSSWSNSRTRCTRNMASCLTAPRIFG